MNPDRWQQIDRLLDEALDRKPKERPAFLEHACAADPELRKEVEALLEAHDKAGSFVQKPALDPAAAPPSHHPAASLVGRRLGPYEVLSPIGRGGMGEVYHARDTRLGRSVALKILPPEFVTDEERMRRFRREAKAASALSHANVATIYDVGESEGTHYIAMEYVEGKTLNQLIGRRGMRLGDALNYGMQIADALAAAHEAGIVHRDLKPGNVMLTAKGQVKVLDFGLAKWKEKVSFGAEDSEATGQPTTEEGRIVGTVAYMSPEQAEGKAVDARSDIFSFGSVLYEMVTGRRAFEGDSTISTLSAILHQEPKPVSGITQSIPADLEKLIHRCLRKDPAKRLQHMDDVKLALEELKEDTDKLADGTPARKRGRSYLRLATVLVAGAVLAVAAWLWVGRQRPAEPDAPMLPVPFTSYPGSEAQACFSPDGNQVVFAWTGEKGENWDIYIKQVGSETPRRLTTDSRSDGSPCWSPDGQLIAFLRSLSDARTAVILISPNGGREREVAELPTLKAGPNRGLAWHPSGKYLAVVCDQADADAPCGIFLLSPETGEKRLLSSPPMVIHGDNSPAFSPDGRTLAFCRNSSGVLRQVYLLQVSQNVLPEGEPRQLTFGDTLACGPTWTADGGEIIYVRGRGSQSSLWRISASGKGTSRPLPFSGRSAESPAVSLQKHRLIYTLYTSQIDIWRCAIPRPGEPPGVPSTLMASTQTEHLARYSPDGKEIAHASWSSGTPEIWVSDSDGSNLSQLTHFGGPDVSALDWSPDGRKLIFQMPSGKSMDLFLISAHGGKEKQLTQTPYNELNPCFSADGKWIFYGSNQTGGYQIWRMADDGGQATQITRKGGFFPSVSTDGRTVYYLKGETPDRPIHELWKVPAGGGEEGRVLGGILRNNFAVREGGIYYATQSTDGVTEFRVHEFLKGKTRHIATIRFPVLYGLSVSPDERWLLFTGQTGAGRDLMLVENFR